MALDDRSTQMQACLDRWRAGDESARDELLGHAVEQLTRLTRKMLRRYPGVHRWEQTDDVFQRAVVRLIQALRVVQPPTVVDFVRLAATQIRRELCDLARHYGGAYGLGANQDSIPVDLDGSGSSSRDTPQAEDRTHDPYDLAVWTEFHRRVEQLPSEDREVFDLLHYQGLSQAEAADLLGVSERTIKRRWQVARYALRKALGDSLTGPDP